MRRVEDEGGAVGQSVVAGRWAGGHEQRKYHGEDPKDAAACGGGAVVLVVVRRVVWLGVRDSGYTASVWAPGFLFILINIYTDKGWTRDRNKVKKKFSRVRRMPICCLA